MASDLNMCCFIGRIGADPETRYSQTGSAITNLRLAVGQQWKDQNGQRQERTEWVSLVAFGNLAEICGQYLVKGSQVYVSGRMQTREWEKDGVKRYSSEIVVDKLQMLGGRQDGQARGEQRKPQQKQTQNRKQQEDNGQSEFFNDDIPF